MNRNDELVKFLEKNHTEIGPFFSFTEQRIKMPETDQRILYESEKKSCVLTYSFKGAFMGCVYLHIKEENYEIFSNLLDFVKYIELCKRKKMQPAKILRYSDEIARAEENPEIAPKEKETLECFIREDEKIILTDEILLQAPSRMVIDKEVFLPEDFSKELAESTLDKIYNGLYKRIEITYNYFYERKGRKIPLNSATLVYLCENKKTMMWYFDEERMFAGRFFENRNNAGMIDSDLLPHTTLCGQDIYEQNVVLDLSIPGNAFVEMITQGKLDYDEGSWRKQGFMEREYFSNKNAYRNYRDEKGGFDYEVL